LRHRPALSRFFPISSPLCLWTAFHPSTFSAVALVNCSFRCRSVFVAILVRLAHCTTNHDASESLSLMRSNCKLLPYVFRQAYPWYQDDPEAVSPRNCLQLPHRCNFMPEAWLRIRKTTTSSGVPYIFAAAEGRKVFGTPSHTRLHDDDRNRRLFGFN
jgi:hypothetical protein